MEIVPGPDFPTGGIILGAWLDRLEAGWSARSR